MIVIQYRYDKIRSQTVKHQLASISVRYIHLSLYNLYLTLQYINIYFIVTK